jgi:hypothetical protein
LQQYVAATAGAIFVVAVGTYLQKRAGKAKAVA